MLENMHLYITAISMYTNLLLHTILNVYRSSLLLDVIQYLSVTEGEFVNKITDALCQKTQT